MSQQLLCLCLIVLVAITTTCSGSHIMKRLLNSIVVDGKGKDGLPPEKIPHKPDRGYFKSCEPGDPPLLFSWSPKNITIGKNVTVSFMFTLPVDISGFHASFSVGIPDYPYPLAEVPYHISCDQIRSILNITCPLRKGERVTVWNYTLKYIFEKFVGGQFIGRLKVKNERNELVLCAHGEVNIIDNSAYPYYNYIY